jgi:hypothetical protein
MSAATVQGAEYYVSPTGTPQGDGSKDKPWDLKTALAPAEAIQPGDTVWLRGGTYTGHFVSNLKGTKEAPIHVRQYPGERAAIDANYNRNTVGGAYPLLIQGGYTWFEGFEMMSSYPKRYFDSDNYGSVERPWGPDIGNSSEVPGIRLINLVIHDLAQGPGVWKGATDNELYGCVIYNNGYDDKARGHGHGTYTQNEKTDRLIIDNIMFNQFSYGIHAYGSDRAFFNNYVMEGNILFNNGAASKVSGFTRNILIGGGKPAENPKVINNYSYYPPEKKAGDACNFNYNKGATNLLVKDNYFVSGAKAFDTKGEGLVASGNTFVGPALNIDPAKYPDNKFMGDKLPTGVLVFVRPNKYEEGRANIAVFNWDGVDTAKVDLSKVLKVGDKYEVRDAQDFFGKPAVTGTFDGKESTLPLNLTSVAQPMGENTKKLEHTSKQFNAFVLLRPAVVGQP